MEKKQNPGRKSTRNPRAPRTPARQPSGSDEVFDTWLENKLKSAYSSVLDEPIPEDLIRLLKQTLKD